MATILVTGCSSGFGLLSAVAFARRGDRVFAGVRDPASAVELHQQIAAEGLQLHVVQLDVTDAVSVELCVTNVVATAGAIDVLVNNAAIVFLGAVEDSDDLRSRAVMETNFFGPLRLVRAVLPHMRAHGRGRIINVSSRNAVNGIAFGGVYSASKAALEALSTALALEIAETGIGVTIIQPGSFHTAIDAKMVASVAPSSVFPGAAESLARTRNANAADDANRVADAIVRAAFTDHLPLRIEIPV
jgi:NAD(P)-dependent dehydrogenase (short-subunit alcohol dehydrogenase family)